ncbi:MAG: NAD(P)-dependent oxidoreductase [Kiritimatiellae bacterium]|nr:NAD(P)-dependent oxidoreductase [Kiritimatiellia bacterium]
MVETILVTGAGGYIGSNAAEYFVKKGYRVAGTVHRHVAERFAKLGARTIRADLTEAQSIPLLFRERIDYVVHIAARASDVGRDEWFREANYESVKRFASAAMEHGVKRFVYLSTSDVYGLHDFHGEGEDDLRFDETASNPYPKYKILSEKWLAENLPPERFSCVRPCVVYGRGDTSITPRTIAYLKNAPVVFHFGKWSGRNRWPLAHVENVCRVLHAAMLVPEAGGKGVTVLDSKRTTLGEYYREIADEFLGGKRLREATIPMWTIRPVAWLSSFLSRNRDHPLFDPTLYALDTVAHNLDFSNRRMLSWLAAAGLEEYVRGEG